MTSSRKLAIGRSGSSPLDFPEDGNIPDRGFAEQEITYAAWQTPETGVPKRVVVRCDGNVVANASSGFPCGVNLIRYTVGGYNREVLIDATNQSSLVVWAETVDVTARWDRRRMARLNGGVPAPQQIVAASISACDCGDTGIGDGRWLDALAVDGTASDPDIEISVHKVPNGARGVRFLNGLDTDGNLVRMANTALKVLFVTSADNAPIEAVNNGVTDQSIITVPVVADQLVITFPLGTLENLESVAWIEWFMAPAMLPGSY